MAPEQTPTHSPAATKTEAGAAPIAPKQRAEWRATNRSDLSALLHHCAPAAHLFLGAAASGGRTGGACAGAAGRRCAAAGDQSGCGRARARARAWFRQRAAALRGPVGLRRCRGPAGRPAWSPDPCARAGGGRLGRRYRGLWRRCGGDAGGQGRRTHCGCGGCPGAVSGGPRLRRCGSGACQADVGSHRRARVVVTPVFFLTTMHDHATAKDQADVMGIVQGHKRGNQSSQGQG
jgi:hypothetical protein